MYNRSFYMVLCHSELLKDGIFKYIYGSPAIHPVTVMYCEFCMLCTKEAERVALQNSHLTLTLSYFIPLCISSTEQGVTPW